MAQVRKAKMYTRPLAIRLEEETYEELRQVADAIGTSPTMLMRMWIVDRLKLEMEVGSGRRSGRLPKEIEAQVRDRLVHLAMIQLIPALRDSFDHVSGQIEADLAIAAREHAEVMRDEEEREPTATAV